LIPCSVNLIQNASLRHQAQAVLEHRHWKYHATISIAQVARCSPDANFAREPSSQAFLFFASPKLLLCQLVLVEEHPQEELVGAIKRRRQAHSIPRHAYYSLCDTN
jgi:hypothetical protein